MKMNTFDEIEESIVETSFGRKRRRNKSNWKREVGKDVGVVVVEKYQQYRVTIIQLIVVH